MRKFTVWTYVVDGGDGSSSVRFFQTEEQAEKALAHEERIMGYGTDSIQEHELEFDAHGELILDDAAKDMLKVGDDEEDEEEDEVDEDTNAEVDSDSEGE